MKQILILLVIVFFAISCDDTTPQPQEESLTTTEQTAAPVEQPEPTSEATTRPNIFNDQQQALLMNYISKEWVDQLSDNVYGFRDAQTDVALEKAYLNSIELFEKIETKLDNIPNIDAYDVMEKLKALDPIMEVYQASCVAECSRFVYDFNITKLQQLAKNTAGDYDDNYFNMLALVEGESGGRAGAWYNFFERTWDYGGGVVLGNKDEFTYNFLKQSHDHLQASPLFATQIQSIREQSLRDMGHPIYMQSQKEVIAEIEKVQAANILNEQEKKLVANILTGVKKGETVDLGTENGRTAGTAIQFDCKTKDCDWGG